MNIALGTFSAYKGGVRAKCGRPPPGPFARAFFVRCMGCGELGYVGGCDLRSFSAIFSPSSIERRVAFSTELINVVRRPPASIVSSPAIALPPGIVTLSFSPHSGSQVTDALLVDE